MELDVWTVTWDGHVPMGDHSPVCHPVSATPAQFCGYVDGNHWKVQVLIMRGHLPVIQKENSSLTILETDRQTGRQPSYCNVHIRSMGTILSFHSTSL